MRSKNIKLYMCCFISLWSSSKGFAGTIVSVQNQESLVSINDELGSILQLPNAVSTITSSKYFSITDIGSPVDPTNGMKTDVRTFQIMPVSHAQSESVTFVLADGKNLSFKFISAKNADKFYDVRLEQTKTRSKSFLSPEMSMLRHMILDEAGEYSRRFFDVPVKSDFKGLKFNLIRMYNTSDFTGYVFDVTNTGSKKQTLTLSNIAFGLPNRAIIAHIDRDSLAVCPLLSVTTDCVTRLHMIIRGTPNPTDDFQSSLSSIHSVHPFMKKGEADL